MKMNIITFDIGGTFIRYNIINENLDLLEDLSTNKIRSPSFHFHTNFSDDELISALIDIITKSIEKIKNKYSSLRIESLGIAFCGTVDNEGRIGSAAPLWGDIINDYPLKAELESVLPYKILYLTM